MVKPTSQVLHDAIEFAISNGLRSGELQKRDFDNSAIARRIEAKLIRWNTEIEVDVFFDFVLKKESPTANEDIWIRVKYTGHWELVFGRNIIEAPL